MSRDNPVVSAYPLADWANFAVASAGAAAALTGLGVRSRLDQPETDP